MNKTTHAKDPAAKPGDPALNRSVSTDRGSVVNLGSEGDEVLTTPAISHDSSNDGEADQSGTRGARGKPGGVIEVNQTPGDTKHDQHR